MLDMDFPEVQVKLGFPGRLCGVSGLLPLFFGNRNVGGMERLEDISPGSGKALN